MREIPATLITETVADLCVRANQSLPADVADALRRAHQQEPWAPAKSNLSFMLRNLQAATDACLPVCQDTGMACVFIDIGQQVHVSGDDLNEAINRGVRQAYTEGYLRKSVVADPIRRGNTGDNTPALVTLRMVPGDGLRITVAPKGFGSENMSRLAMLKPADGREGVENFVLETVRLAGSNPCPPVILGVGIGGSFDKVALMAKRALLQPLNRRHPDPYYAEMELSLMEKINELGIGPAGYGGATTALGLAIETAPTHIAGLPVAVNVSCHVTRRATAQL